MRVRFLNLTMRKCRSGLLKLVMRFAIERKNSSAIIECGRMMSAALSIMRSETYVYLRE